MSGDGPGERPSGTLRARKKPRKITEKYLENAAMFYLQRYSATVAGV